MKFFITLAVWFGAGFGAIWLARDWLGHTHSQSTSCLLALAALIYLVAPAVVLAGTDKPRKR